MWRSLLGGKVVSDTCSLPNTGPLSNFLYKKHSLLLCFQNFCVCGFSKESTENNPIPNSHFGDGIFYYLSLVSYKIKHTLPSHHIMLQSCFSVFTSKNWKLCPNSSLHTEVYRNFFYNYQSLKQTRCPSEGEWINCGIFGHKNIMQH